jgi:hypothetical protein
MLPRLIRWPQAELARTCRQPRLKLGLPRRRESSNGTIVRAVSHGPRSPKRPTARARNSYADPK